MKYVYPVADLLIVLWIKALGEFFCSNIWNCPIGWKTAPKTLEMSYAKTAFCECLWVVRDSWWPQKGRSLLNECCHFQSHFSPGRGTKLKVALISTGQRCNQFCSLMNPLTAQKVRELWEGWSHGCAWWVTIWRGMENLCSSLYAWTYSSHQSNC